MAELRAFVGHSFGREDAALIRKFTDYLDRISRLVPQFSWTHAEPAEPKPLNEKVMEQIDGKNLFIGICSKKEYIISENSARRLVGNWLIVDQRTLRAKTSDWITQEIGLAIGKGLKLIILLEDGLAQPGGLQGDIEYIPFNRDSPEQAFGKLLEMVTALMPAHTVNVIPSTEISLDSVSGRDQVLEQPPGEGDAWDIPKPDWNRIDYEIAYSQASALHEEGKAKKIEDAYLDTDDARDERNRASWQAFCEYRRLLTGLSGSLEGLQRLAEQHSDNIDVKIFLAHGHEYYGDHQKSAQLFESTANQAETAREYIRNAGRAAVAYARGRALVQAERILDELRARLSEPESEATFLRAFREIADITGNKEMLTAALEGLIRINAADRSVRFSLAYSHQDIGNNDLALLHYLKIPDEQRMPMAWNNLVAAFAEFGLRAKSIDALQEAVKGGETLAMSNLAHRFLLAGFLAKAQKECDRALRVAHYHKNIGNVLMQVKQLPDEEQDKQRETLEAAAPKANFYQKLGRAIAEAAAELKGRWRGPDGVLDVSVQAGRFLAKGTYEKEEPANPLLLGVGAARQQTIRYELTFEGVVLGRVVQAQAKRIRQGGTTPFLLSGDQPQNVLMVLQEGGEELQATEASGTSQPNFYSLFRIVDDSRRS
jgi:hypothetical protein